LRDILRAVGTITFGQLVVAVPPYVPFAPAQNPPAAAPVPCPILQGRAGDGGDNAENSDNSGSDDDSTSPPAKRQKKNIIRYEADDNLKHERDSDSP
jgi:hypothetical protein